MSVLSFVAEPRSNAAQSYISRLFAPENLPNIALVIVGIGGILTAVYTLKVLRRQALSMRRQTTHLRNSVTAAKQNAKAALLNAKALINAERAWILAELDWYKTGNVIEGTSRSRGQPERESTTAYLKLLCRNEGRSPAWINGIYGQMKIVNGVTVRQEPVVPHKTELQHAGTMGVLAPGRERSQCLELSCEGRQHEGEFLSVFVLIEYRDVFDRPHPLITTMGYTISRGNHLNRQDGIPERQRNT